MSRLLKRLSVGASAEAAVKPYLMLEGETRQVSIDFRALCGVKGVSLSSAAWEVEDGVTLSGASVSGGVASVNFTADTSGIWPVTCLATFSNGEKSRKVWRAEVREARASGLTGTTGAASEVGNNGGGIFSPGEVEFEASLYEAAGDATSITVTVTRSGGLFGAASVVYATSDGTATEGEDYEEATGVLTWPADDSDSRSFGITLISPRNGGTVILTLSSPSGVSIGDIGVATLEIYGAGQIRLTAEEFYASETDGQANITVERVFGDSSAASVEYATADGTAVEPGDYTLTTGALNWADGEDGVQSFYVPIESVETITEYSTESLYAWEEENDPRNAQNEHEYSGDGTWRDTLAQAIEDHIAAFDTPSARFNYLLGWSSDLRSLNRAYPENEPGETEVLYLHFNKYLPNHTTLSYESVMPKAGGGLVCGDMFEAGVAVNSGWFWWSGKHADATDEVNYSGVFSLVTAGTTDPDRSYFNNCTVYPSPFPQAQAIADATIRVRRVPKAPSNPCDGQPPFPGDGNFCVIGSEVVRDQDWTRVESVDGFKSLQTYGTEDGEVTRYPLNPIRPVGHADDEELFWTNAATEAGLTGKTFDAQGDGDPDTTFPVLQDYCYQRQYKPVKAFGVALSNASGAELIQPDTATVYIIPSS